MEGFDEQVWKIVLELGANERHFNQLQHQYRMLASTWLLAMFGGVGFALSHDPLGVPPELLVTVTGLAAALGVTQLWSLDLRVYHQLLDSCFAEGLRLERLYAWLPQIRAGMMATQGDGESPGVRRARKPAGVLARVVWFYMTAVSIALIVAFVGLAIDVASRWPQLPSAPLVVTALAAAVIGMWDYEIYRRTLSPTIDLWRRSAAKSAA